MKKNKNAGLKSNCCNAKVKIVGRSTWHFECKKCHQPCDVFNKGRIIVEMNTATKIIPDKREKIKNKQFEKDIREIGHA